MCHDFSPVWVCVHTGRVGQSHSLADEEQEGPWYHYLLASPAPSLFLRFTVVLSPPHPSVPLLQRKSKKVAAAAPAASAEA